MSAENHAGRWRRVTWLTGRLILDNSADRPFCKQAYQSSDCLVVTRERCRGGNNAARGLAESATTTAR